MAFPGCCWPSEVACVAAQAGFCLPQVTPVVVSSFNWTPVMVGLILGAVLLVWYLPRYGAQYWYHGKAHLLPDTSVVSLPLLCSVTHQRPCSDSIPPAHTSCDP